MKLKYIINKGDPPANLVALREGERTFHASGLFQRLPSYVGVGSRFSEGYIVLIAAIIRSGLEDEGPKYLQTRGGRFWCWWGDLEPQVVWEQGVHLGYWRPEPKETKAAAKQ